MSKEPSRSPTGHQEAASSELSLYTVFHQLILVISDLTAGCLKIDKVVGDSRKHSLEKFASFLQVLEAYGTGYDDDIGPRSYKIRDKVSHRLSAIKDLQKIKRIYEIAILQLKDSGSLGFSLSLDRYSAVDAKALREQLLTFLQFQENCFEELVSIQKRIEDVPDQNADFCSPPQGHLVKMTCGHRGIPCRPEEKRVSRLLRKSGFIPMLDEPKPR